VYVNVLAMPQNASDPRSFPTMFSGPGPYRPPLAVPPGQTQTFTSLVQVPFETTQPTQVHAVVRADAATLTSDVPLKLTAAGPAHRLKIELRADQRQWCARATDADGHAPTGALLAAMT